MMKGWSWFDAAKWFDRRLDDVLEQVLGLVCTAERDLVDAGDIAYGMLRSEYTYWAGLSTEDTTAQLEYFGSLGLIRDDACSWITPHVAEESLVELVSLGYLERAHPAAALYRSIRTREALEDGLAA